MIERSGEDKTLENVNCGLISLNEIARDVCAVTHEFQSLFGFLSSALEALRTKHSRIVNAANASCNGRRLPPTRIFILLFYRSSAINIYNHGVNEENTQVVQELRNEFKLNLIYSNPPKEMT